MENHAASKVSPQSIQYVPRERRVKFFINPISVGIVPVRSLRPFMIKEREQKDAFEIE